MSLAFVGFVFAGQTLFAQSPLKERPDAFPPKAENIDSKAINMAETVDEMASWDRYPTYETYLALMQGWADRYPDLCHIDTIGRSVQDRLILCARIQGNGATESANPEFFYSSTMHGDEVTGFVLMLRLIDTLLSGYGTNQQYTNLIDSVDIYINPLSNPDGTYRGGNSTVRYAMRYNANYVDLNRNFPDPFGTPPTDEQQVENTAMIEYVSSHSFRLSANLHGGSEVMNYPWDSFTSSENPHPDSDWWQQVCKRFVDTSRTYSSSHFRDVNSQGYIAGGDWYVIPNGRQDYMNYYHNCREMTMEISTIKLLGSEQLSEYWRFMQHPLVNYIAEIHTFTVGNVGVNDAGSSVGMLAVYPNPAKDKVFLSEAVSVPSRVYNVQGQCVLQVSAGARCIDIKTLPQGVYILRVGNRSAKIVKR